MPFRVGVYAHEVPSPFHLSVPGVVVHEVNHSGLGEWEMRVCALRPGNLHSADGYDVRVPWGVDELESADLVIVPSWLDPDLQAPGPLIDALRSAHERGAVVAGMCLGAFPVAEAGLLDGRRATTHWRATEVMRRRFPKVQVDSTALYVDEGDVVTSAGTAAALDACLHLVRSILGPEAANIVARGLVVAPHRSGGQAQFIERPVTETDADDPMAAVLDWILEHLDEELDVDALATHAHMSRRTFSRNFVRHTGETPATWVRRQRVAEAQRLLETTSHSIEKIASLAGFASAITMRQNFTSEVGLSPAAYRSAFHR